MNTQNSALAYGGEFYYEHYDSEGNLKDKGKMHNLFVDEGLVYALNVAFAGSIGGAVAPISQFYIGLSTSFRNWVAGDNAGNVHSNSNEFELYTGNRPEWSPQAIAEIGSIELNDTGAEASFTISDLSGQGGSETIYGAFVISAQDKTGGGDGSATMLSGTNFTAAREIFSNDLFKIGYVLKAESGTT